MKKAFPFKHATDRSTGISQRLYIATKLLCATISNQEGTVERFNKYEVSESELNFDEYLVEDMYEIADELIRQDES